MRKILDTTCLTGEQGVSWVEIEMAKKKVNRSICGDVDGNIGVIQEHRRGVLMMLLKEKVLFRSRGGWGISVLMN